MCRQRDFLILLCLIAIASALYLADINGDTWFYGILGGMIGAYLAEVIFKRQRKAVS